MPGAGGTSNYAGSLTSQSGAGGATAAQAGMTGGGGMSGGGQGSLIQIFGNAIASTLSSANKRRIALEQKKKGKELLTKANQVVTKDITTDPAYKIKQFLAQQGLPGYEIYKDNILQNQANAVYQGTQTAGSGGSMLAYLASLQGGTNQQLNDLSSKNANFIAGNQSNLAEERYNWQQIADEIANTERRKLSKAASQHEEASTLNKYAADEQDTALIGSTFSNMGELMK